MSSQKLQEEMKVTHMHTLRSHIWAGQLRSRSTCPCGGHRGPARCTTLRSAGRNSCSSHSRPRQSSPLGRSGAFSDTYRATGKTAASQKQPAHLWKSAEHYSEHCRDPGCVEGEGGGAQYCSLLLTKTCYRQSGLAHWKINTRYSKERKGKKFFFFF